MVSISFAFIVFTYMWWAIVRWWYALLVCSSYLFDDRWNEERHYFAVQRIIKSSSRPATQYRSSLKPFKFQDAVPTHDVYGYNWFRLKVDRIRIDAGADVCCEPIIDLIELMLVIWMLWMQWCRGKLRRLYSFIEK